MCTDTQKEVYYVRLAHEIRDADKSHNQQKRRKASDVQLALKQHRGECHEFTYKQVFSVVNTTVLFTGSQLVEYMEGAAQKWRSLGFGGLTHIEVSYTRVFN